MTESASQDALLGQVQAIGMTLTALIASLDPTTAASVRRRLAESLDVAHAEDTEHDRYTATRDVIAQSYLELLGTLAAHA